MTSSENLFCGGTYQKILDHVAAPALARADIRLCCEVEQIQYPSGTSSKVVVQLVSGEILTCDEVVVTTPLGWLKRNPSAFLPALPRPLTQAINSIGYGCLEKVRQHDFISSESVVSDEGLSTSSNQGEPTPPNDSQSCQRLCWSLRLRESFARYHRRVRAACSFLVDHTRLHLRFLLFFFFKVAFCIKC